MESFFTGTFFSIFQAIFKVFLIASLAGYMSYKKVFTEEFIDGLSVLVVRVFLPLQIFATIMKSFDPAAQTYWWYAPLVAMALAFGGLIFSGLLFARNIKEKKSLFPLSGMQNAVYLALPIGEFAFKDQFPEFSLICFLVLMGLNPIMWSVGKILITKDGKNGSLFKKIVTPPFIASLLGILLVLTGGKRFVPEILVDASRMLGNATVPVATFVLGSTLAMSMRKIPPFWDTFRIVFVKFIILPAATVAALYFLKTGQSYPLLAQVLILQSATAPATAHILMVRTYGGDIGKVGGIIFVSYIVCLFAIPFWLMVWNGIG
ncbi:MAG: AEC family transporter [Bacteroidales bacterium]|nr:AEC family transporter [Bacteroidales bacterium]